MQVNSNVRTIDMKNKNIHKITYKHTDGSILEGLRVVEGTTKLRQIVVYQGKYIPDNETYLKDQESRMYSAAEQIMYEFASGRTLEAREYKPSVKF